MTLQKCMESDFTRELNGRSKQGAWHYFLQEN